MSSIDIFPDLSSIYIYFNVHLIQQKNIGRFFKNHVVVFKTSIENGKKRSPQKCSKGQATSSAKMLFLFQVALFITTKDKSKNTLRSNKDDDDDGVKANANPRIVWLCIIFIPFACSTYSKFWIFIQSICWTTQNTQTKYTNVDGGISNGNSNDVDVNVEIRIRNHFLYLSV